MVDQEGVDISPQDTAEQAFRKVMPCARTLLARQIDHLLAGTATETPQDDWTELQRDLSVALGSLASLTARCHRDDVGQILDELFPIIREHIVRRVDELGLAR